MTFTIDKKSPYYEHDLKLMRKANVAFEKMLLELAMLDEYIEQGKLHLLEYKLSKNTRRVYNEIKHQNNSNFKKLLEEAAATDATTAANPALDTGKNILGLINKFHQDNSAEIGLLSSDDTFKTSIPKNIGAQPGILKKITSKAIGAGSKLGQMTVNFLISILTGAFQKMEKAYSQFKSDFLDAKKQDTAWKFIYSKMGPSMTVAKRKEDGTIEYVKDSSGPGFLNWLKDFVTKNPKWANVVVGILINGAKFASVTLAGATGGASLAVGVIVGLILRTLVGRLKGESWGTAIKKAVIVTGMSLIGGAITKGLFSYFKGGGFLDGAKSYFTGVPGTDQAASAISNQTLDAKAIAYAKAMKGAANLSQFKQTPEYNEMIKNLSISDSSRSTDAAASKIATFFANKDKVSDVQLQSFFKSGLSGRLAILTKQGVPTDKIFSNTANTVKSAIQQAEIDMETLKMPNISNLTSQLHKAFPPDQPPTADSLLKFFTNKGLNPESAKDLAKSITGGDNASAAEKFRDLWRMGGTSGDTTIFNKLKLMGDLPKDQYDKLLGSADATDAATTVVGGLKNLSGSQLKDMVSKAGGPDKFLNQLEEKNPELYQKLLAATDRYTQGQGGPDFQLKNLLYRPENEVSVRTFNRIINAAGGLPQSTTGDVVTQAAGVADAATAVVGGLKKLTTPQLEDLLKKSGGAIALRNALEDDIAYSAKLTAAAEKLYPMNDSDRAIQYIFNQAARGDVEQLQNLLNATGGLPQSVIDTETAAQQALQVSGGFKLANPEVAKQILAKAGLPADATSESVFSKGVKGVFGTMSMDPEQPFAESTNKLNRFLLDYVKESSSQGQSGLSATGFFNYLSSKTGVPLKSLSQMIAGENAGETALVKQHLTQVLNQAAANADAGGTAKDTLYALSREMMGNLSEKMQQYPTLMRDFGVSAADVAKQSAINQAKNAGTQMIQSAPQSLGSLGLDESIYKKMIKNLYL